MPIFAPGAPTYNSEGELIAGVSAEGLNAGFSVAMVAIGTIADLQAYVSAPTSAAVQTQCYILGYAATSDGGEGPFSYDPTDTTSADNGGTIIVDGLGRRWHRLTGGRVYAAYFGVDMTGSIDSTNQFLAALNYTVAIGGTLYLGPGKIQISTVTINANTENLSIVGAGKFATAIVTNAATGNVLALTSSYLELKDFSVSSSVTRTAGSMIACTGNTEVITGIGFDKFFIGITGTGNDGTWRDFVFTNPAASAIGIVVTGYPVSILIDNPTFYQGANTPVSGINLQNCTGGVIISHPEIEGYGNNLLIDPGTGQGVFSLQVFGGYMDGGINGIAINASGNGNVARCKFVGVETNSTASNGVVVENSGTGTVTGIEFINHMGSLNASGAGISVIGGANSPTAVTISGGTFAGNSTGISFGAGVTDFSIIGTQAGGYAGIGGNTDYGIFVATGASTRYVITDNRVSFNGIAGIVDGGTGSSKAITGNVGFNPVPPTTVTLSGSPFSFTNTLGYPVVMIVTGGTVSSVTLNGSQVSPSSPCSVVVPPASVFAIAYSAAPTVERLGLA